MKKLDKLRASTVGNEDFNALLMAFQLLGKLVSPCDIAETADGSKVSVIYGHANSKRFNAQISLLYLLP